MQSFEQIYSSQYLDNHLLTKAMTQQPQANRGFAVQWAESEEDVRAAQRLRHLVFMQEMGARLDNTGTQAANASGLDSDYFDQFCDHLLVRLKTPADAPPGPVIGTYRVMAPAAAARAGRLYTETEFDLAPLASLRDGAVELGRSCVHPAWRSGGVIMALWSALGQYMHQQRLHTMIGCASISLADGGRSAPAIWARLRPVYLVEPRWQVLPRTPLSLDMGEHTARSPSPGFDRPPPLLKGYLRCGARLLGPPAYDAAFNTADLPIMMRIDELAPRYRRHFLGH